MKKKLLALAAVAAVVMGVAGMSAFEAHIINVTAHIENALSVSPDEIKFGTVFPQEYLQRNLNIALSDSFTAEDRADDVEYRIVQKPKCKANDPQADPQYMPVDRNSDECPVGYTAMLNLCQYLSKTTTDNNDSGVPSYFTPANNGEQATCRSIDTEITQGIATGRLSKKDNDLSDEWIVDLKVPPVAGTVAQDWPANCPVIPENDKDYGCDLWIEATNVSVNYVDGVDIGNLESETGHNLIGWGPIEPTTHGGGWGNIATDPLSFDKKTRVIYAPVEVGGGSTTDASLTLDFGPVPVSGSRYLVLRHLDGQAPVDDFDVYLNGAKLAHYVGDSNTAEIWKVSYFEIPASAPSLSTVRLVSTDAQWSLWSTYGQVAFDIIKSTNAPEGVQLIAN